MNKQIISLYEHYKNHPKKLKIVCDWDEVLQATEPYALWKATNEISPDLLVMEHVNFSKFFEGFWLGNLRSSIEIKYSPYGSSLKIYPSDNVDYKELREKTKEIKNSPDFYQTAPFLTIAEDLLKLIKEDKVDRLIFLSAYDKRKFPDIVGREKCFSCRIQTDGEVKNGHWKPCENCPILNGDFRKYEIFAQTFSKVLNAEKTSIFPLQLIGFDSEKQGQTKADWIKENAADFDLVIDDNPNICKSVIDSRYWPCDKCVKTGNDLLENCKSGRCSEMKMTVLAPYYPAIENQHHSEVVLIKQEVSNLTKENFSK